MSKNMQTVLQMLLAVVIGISVILLFAAGVNSQEGRGPALIVSWTEVTQQEDGTVIGPNDISYRVYNANTGATLCNTAGQTCEIPIGYSECMAVFATAYMPSTGLESVPSDTVEGCSDPKPLVPLKAPAIRVEIR